MTALERNEIDGLKSDKQAGEALLEQNMSNFARELKEGLGEAMIDELKNPQKAKVERGFWYRFKQWRKKMSENLKIIFYS